MMEVLKTVSQQSIEPKFDLQRKCQSYGFIGVSLLQAPTMGVLIVLGLVVIVCCNSGC